MSNNPYREIHDFTVYTLLPAASAFVRETFQRYVDHDEALDVITKEDDTPASYADRECERIMHDLIEAQYPQHGIIGEEFGAYNAGADYVWVLDPVDGTKEFLEKKPGYFCTLIALLHKGKPVLGIIHDPMAYISWVGLEGQQSIKTTMRKNPATTIEKAHLACTDLSMFTGTPYEKTAQALSEECRHLHSGTNGNGFGHVATCIVDIVYECGLKLHDIAPLIPVIKTYGSYAYDLEGNNLLEHIFDPQKDIDKNFSILAGCNENLTKSVLQRFL